MSQSKQGVVPPRVLGAGLVIAGVALAALSLTADVLGIGAPGSVFGYRQFLGTVAGLSMLVVGVALLMVNGTRPAE